MATAPARSEEIPPAFLRPAQVDAWRRAMAALVGWRGAVLAEPVGSGKTWVALGLAARWPGRCTVIGPATLATQWRLAANRAQVPIAWHSLESVSRGRLPPPASLVIVDEAHRLRHPDTRRVATISPWLVGRTTLLLTATPIVNRRGDLFAILSLVVADDALALDGVPSLRALALQAAPPPALRRLVIRSSTATDCGLATVTRRMRVSRRERERAARVITAVDGLVLAAEPEVRRLLVTVLLDAGASSDAAWQAALRRYRALLLQSRDAGGASRAILRQFAGTALDQLVFWSLLGEVDRTAPPPLDDLPRIDAALAVEADDVAWIDSLRRTLRDGRVTACFCRHRATAVALARALGPATAWITGDAAGIGPHRMPRTDLLAAFGPERDSWRLRRVTPQVLVATEVLAEGLDLQGASRVVHVDMPWHATRLEQRTGRVRRAGQRAEHVEVVFRATPRCIERRLAVRRRIATKGRISARWLGALERNDALQDPLPDAIWVGTSALRSADAATARVMLAAGERMGVVTLGVGCDGSVRIMDRGVDSGDCVRARADDLRKGSAMAAMAARAALGIANGPTGGHGRLIARVLMLARERAVHRDAASLAHLDRLLALATTPGPRGLKLLLEELVQAPDAVLLRARLPGVPARVTAAIRWIAVVLYRRGPARLP